jgi:hypothetical protein
MQIAEERRCTRNMQSLCAALAKGLQIPDPTIEELVLNEGSLPGYPSGLDRLSLEIVLGLKILALMLALREAVAEATLMSLSKFPISTWELIT